MDTPQGGAPPTLGEAGTMNGVEVVLDGEGGRRLVLRDLSGTEEDMTYTAVLSMPDGHASVKVWDYRSDLAAFVRGLAEAWRGFNGVKEYTTLEGHLVLSCRHDGRGTIACRAQLSQLPEWSMELELEFGAGAHMDRLANDVEDFFAHHS